MLNLQPEIKNQLSYASLLVSKGKITKAIKMYDKLMKKYPNNISVLHMSGYALIKDNQRIEAEKRFKKAISIKPNYLELNLDYCNLLIESKKYNDAHLYINQLIKNFPNESKIHYMRGCLLLDLRKYMEAVNDFKYVLNINPDDIDALFNIGVAYFNIGESLLAIQSFSKRLKVTKADIETLRYISNCYYRLNYFEKANEVIDIVIKADNQNSDSWYEKGLIAEKMQDINQAKNSYLKSISLNSSHFDAFWNLSLIVQKENKLNKILFNLDDIINKKDNKIEYFTHKSIIYYFLKDYKKSIENISISISLFYKEKDKGKIDLYDLLIKKATYLQGEKSYNEANKIYDDILNLKPSYHKALTNKGLVLIQLKEYKDAIKFLEKSIHIEPNVLKTYLHLSSALSKIEKYKEALEILTNAEKLDNNSSLIKSEMGHVLTNLSNYVLAEKKLLEAIEIDPGNQIAYSNIASIEIIKGSHEKALIWLNKAKSIQNHDFISEKILSDIYIKMTHCYNEMQEYQKGLEVLKKLEKLDVDYPRGDGLLYYTALLCCEWENLDKYYNKSVSYINQNQFSISPFTTLLVSDDPKLQYDSAKITFESAFKKIQYQTNKHNNYSKNKNHTLPRIAFLSSDFYGHATSFLMAGLFENLNNSDFIYHAFSYGKKKDNSNISHRVKNAFSNFHYVENKSNKQISDQLRELEIDIAIDLKGYTKDTRIGILANRPSPIQVTYLGFPSTLNTDFIDYILLDKFIVTKDNERFFSENIIKLPNCYQCTDDKRTLPLTIPPSKKTLGLPDNTFIFCSLNNQHKYNPQIFDIWMQLLNENKSSVIWFLDNGNSSNTNLKKEALKRGVSAERLIFAPKLKSDDHINRMSQADLFLDSYPCGAHTTASDALWANLPVLTMSGRSMSSRVAGSILTSIGLEELITNNFQDYKLMANELCKKPEKLLKIKNKLLKNKFQMPLFKSKQSARNLEKSFHILWKNFLENKPMENISIG